MSALYTHYQFGQDILNNLNKKIQKEIKANIEYYNMFNQGFDNLYYHFRWTYYRNFGINAHKHNIDLFFKNIIIYIKNNNLENNSDITNIVYGFINHYTLDTLLHPYINYQVQELNIPHTKIEFMLDSQIDLNFQTNKYKVLIPKLNFEKELQKFINIVFEKTYNEKNIGKIFNKSHTNGYYLYRYFITDKYGIKTFLYKIIDILIPFKKFKLSKNTFYIKTFDERLLNKEKNIWNKPNNKLEQYKYSYDELYNICLKICIKLNNNINYILKNNKEIDEIINMIKLIDLKNIQQLLEQ